MTPLGETLARALETPRAISMQVIRHLGDVHGVGREAVGAFLDTELGRLEDYEVELILAPLFTPTLQDQALVAEQLGPESIPPEQWPELVRGLEARPTKAGLQTEAGGTHFVPLPEVIIKRFVYRLRLDGTIPADVLCLIGGVPPPRSLLTAIARRAIWENPGRRELLVRFLTRGGEKSSPADAVALLKLVETYEPTNTADLLGRMAQWQQILRQEINAAGAKPFFNERVEELHGGGRDQRRQRAAAVAAKEQEREFLLRLEQVLREGASA